jgi:hypothetical protein
MNERNAVKPVRTVAVSILYNNLLDIYKTMSDTVRIYDANNTMHLSCLGLRLLQHSTRVRLLNRISSLFTTRDPGDFSRGFSVVQRGCRNAFSLCFAESSQTHSLSHSRPFRGCWNDTDWLLVVYYMLSWRVSVCYRFPDQERASRYLLAAKKNFFLASSCL